jgi:hypothetical protein
MSYSHHFVGVVFRTELPFKDVETSFERFCQEWEGRGSCELALLHDNADDDKADGSNYGGDSMTRVEIYHQFNSDAKLVYALCEWVSEVMADKEVRVYVSSSSDVTKDDPFFYIITKRGVRDVSVDELFASRTKGGRTDGIVGVVVATYQVAFALMQDDEQAMATIDAAFERVTTRPRPSAADLGEFGRTVSVTLLDFLERRGERSRQQEAAKAVTP